jgi:hypothetical protein
MSTDIYRYKFNDRIPVTEVRYSILLAALAAEGVHGQAQVLLDAGYFIDEKTHACVVDATTPVGRTISQIFTRFLTREFGEDGFSVERVDGPSTSLPGDSGSDELSHFASEIGVSSGEA